MASFFAKPDPKQVAKQSKREIGRSQREMNREKSALDREEAKLLREIKAAAKKGQKGQTASLAKQLVRLRAQRDRLIGMTSQLGAVKTQLTTMQTTVTMASAVASTTNAMKTANRAMDTAKMQATMQDFQQSMGMMEMNEELMSDALSDAFDNDELEEEADAHVAQASVRREVAARRCPSTDRCAGTLLRRQVLDELGVELGGMLSEAPTGRVGAAPVAASAAAAKQPAVALGL